MNKEILVIIGGRGIGDLIYHLPLLRSIYKTYNNKIFILSNKVNKASQVYKNETFYKKIISFDNNRYNFFKTINKIFLLKNKINKLKPKLIFLTSNTTRLVIPVLMSNSNKNYIMDAGKFYFKKNPSAKNLTVSEKIIRFTNIIGFKKKDNSFFLKTNKSKNYISNSKNIFINIDSHHNQNNWDIKNFILIIEKLLPKYKIFVNFSPNKDYFIKLFPSKIISSKQIIFTYKKNITEIIKIINSCKTIIGNESGPICLAASLKKKVHALYIPKHTKPESSMINPDNKYYNVDRISSKNIIKKILKSI